MPRISKADRAVVRLALRLAINTEENHFQAYDRAMTHHLNDAGQWVDGPDPYAVEVQAHCARNIANFRRLLATHFGGPEDQHNPVSIPLSELMKRSTNESQFVPPKIKK